MPRLESIEFWVNFYALLVSLVGILLSTRKLRHFWKTRHLRRVWGLRDGDSVIVVCSELDNPETRQNVEPREFIYCLKYGDVDAYFEVVTTLLRLYPRVKLRVMSAGEIEATKLDLARHIIIIGGPDYNALARRVLSWGITQFDYRTPYLDTRSTKHPKEIVIFDKLTNKEYCHTADIRDYGYFERTVNPHNPDSRVVLVGGCHTIGVTGAVKAFSMAESEEGEIPHGVLRNASLVAKRIGRNKSFSVLVEAERIGQTISAPVVTTNRITVIGDLERAQLRRSTPRRSGGMASVARPRA
jgi:hypothetical protein